MPTSPSRSAASRRASRRGVPRMDLDHFGELPRRRSRAGSSDVIGSWKIMLISSPAQRAQLARGAGATGRARRRCAGATPRSRPGGVGRRPMTARLESPSCRSPTRRRCPSVSPGSRSKETRAPRRARVPRCVSNTHGRGRARESSGLSARVAHLPRSLGSRASRRPSPRMLSASSVEPMAAAGQARRATRNVLIGLIASVRVDSEQAPADLRRARRPSPRKDRNALEQHDGRDGEREVGRSPPTARSGPGARTGCAASRRRARAPPR